MTDARTDIHDYNTMRPGCAALRRSGAAKGGRPMRSADSDERGNVATALVKILSGKQTADHSGYQNTRDRTGCLAANVARITYGNTLCTFTAKIFFLKSVNLKISYIRLFFTGLRRVE